MSVPEEDAAVVGCLGVGCLVYVFWIALVVTLVLVAIRWLWLSA